jgi:hypothetical protein
LNKLPYIWEQTVKYWANWSCRWKNIRKEKAIQTLETLNFFVFNRHIFQVLESSPGGGDGPTITLLSGTNERTNGHRAPTASSSGVSGPYAHCAWYYGRLTREQSDSLLDANGDEGDFLVRDSESNVSLLTFPSFFQGASVRLSVRGISCLK